MSSLFLFTKWKLAHEDVCSVVWRLALFCNGSCCLLWSTLRLLCILCCSSAPWSCLSVSACICFWWLGSECGTFFKMVHHSGLRHPRNLKAECGVLRLFGGVMKSASVSSCKHIFLFLAWLICMLLAGSCPNRGCHLIKSIICWLNLLELRRKRSVHAISISARLSLCLSLIHSFTYLYSEGEKSTHIWVMADPSQSLGTP